MSVTKMLGKDAIFAALAECYITIGDKRYNFMQAINLEATIEKNKTEVPILGQTGKGNKAAGWTGSGSMEAHLNQSADHMAEELQHGQRHRGVVRLGRRVFDREHGLHV